MGKNCLRKQRKKNESDGLFHLHLGGGVTPKEYISSSDFDKIISSNKQEIIGASIFSDSSPAIAPKYERMRFQIKAVLTISCIFGLFIFLVAMAFWIYNAIYYPTVLSNGLKYILGLMAVEGQALACTSLMGYEMYHKQFTSRPALVFYNSVASLVVVLLALACATQPDVNEMVDTVTSVITNLRSEMNRQFPDHPYVTKYEYEQWCCGYLRYKPNCNEWSDELINKLPAVEAGESQETTSFWGLSNLTVLNENSTFMDNRSDHDWVVNPALLSVQRGLDKLCGRLYGWSMAATLIKSMSHYVVPGFMCISLMATLIHLAACSTDLEEIHCPKSSENSNATEIIVDDDQAV